METSPGTLWIPFSPDTKPILVYIYTLCWSACGTIMYRCIFSCMQYFLFNACVWVCICKCVCTFVCVCVLRSVPLCFASVQKGLVPTTWCRAASAPPIPAWIATLAANQKLPAAFAVCPLSIFSNTSLNLLASLGCCIKTPHSTRSQIISFLCLR